MKTYSLPPKTECGVPWSGREALDRANPGEPLTTRFANPHKRTAISLPVPLTYWHEFDHCACPVQPESLDSGIIA